MQYLPFFFILFLVAPWHGQAQTSDTNAIPNYYEILGVGENAAEKAIVDAFHRAYKEATDRTSKDAILNAFQILSDPKKRQSYDSQRQRQRYVENTSERREQLSADLQRRYGLGVTRRFAAALATLAKEETRKELDRVNRAEEKLLDWFARNGVTNPTRMPHEVSERFDVAQTLIRDSIDQFLQSGPTTAQTLDVADALADHHDTVLFRFGHRGEDFRRVLSHARDNPVSKPREDQFHDLFLRWYDESPAGQTVKPWFDRYAELFPNSDPENLLETAMQKSWHGERSQQLLPFVGSVPPRVLLEQLRSQMQSRLIRDPNYFKDRQHLEELKPVVDAILKQDSTLEKEIKRNGGPIGWLKLYVTEFDRCTYYLGRISRMKAK